MTPHKLSDFDYALPGELIAQFPAKTRTQSRLLCVPEKVCEPILHQQFPDLISHINSGDLLVFNNTKVIPARLFGRKEIGGKIECLIERVLDDHSALAHIRASHAPQINSKIFFEHNLEAIVIHKKNNLYELKFTSEQPLFLLLEQFGKIPLPPYIAREADDEDKKRYQTIYAKHNGAIAAPTAGLHFDEIIIDKLKEKGVELGFLTLHVGAGTFQPIRTDRIDQHDMHGEIINVSEKLCEQILAAKKRNAKIIAVGTTVVRALESAAISGEIKPYAGETKIFIQPGFEFHCVDRLLTNFHLPRSTLLMLVSAFAGYDCVMNAYKLAVQNNYRFYSYGDAMLLYHSR